MASIHFSSFDYHEFQIEAAPIVSRLDNDDVTPLRERAYQIVQRIVEGGTVSKSLPLFVHGAPIPISVSMIRDNANPSTLDIGYWLLLVLGEHLKTPTLSIWEGARLLRESLTQLGWNAQVTNSLLNGVPLFRLIKPEINAEEPKSVEDGAPYWYWVRIWGGATGWLPSHSVATYLQELIPLQQRVDQIDLAKLKWINYDDPVVARDMRDHLVGSFCALVSKLREAVKRKEGLLLTSLVVS